MIQHLQDTQFDKYRNQLIGNYDIDFYKQSIDLLFNKNDDEIKEHILIILRDKRNRSTVKEYFEYEFVLKIRNNIDNIDFCILLPGEEMDKVHYSAILAKDKTKRYIDEWLKELEESTNKNESFCYIEYNNVRFKIFSNNNNLKQGKNFGYIHYYYNHWNYCLLLQLNKERAVKKLDFIQKFISDYTDKKNTTSTHNVFTDNFNPSLNEYRIEKIKEEYKNADDLTIAILIHLFHTDFSKFIVEKLDKKSFLKTLIGSKYYNEQRYKNMNKYLGSYSDKYFIKNDKKKHLINEVKSKLNAIIYPSKDN